MALKAREACLGRLLPANAFRIATYDDKTDLLKFPSARELVLDIDRQCLADALTWMPYVEPLVPSGGTVIDVGGYRGVTAQWLARRSNRVYVFEPLPENALTIERVIAARHLRNVEVITQAVADTVRSDYLNVCVFKGHNSLGPLTASPIVNRVPVTVTTLDAFAAERGLQHVDVLKLDVEGFEYEALKGAHRLLSGRAVTVIVFEALRSAQGLRRPARGMIFDLLGSHGYHVFTIRHRKPLSREGFITSASTDFIAAVGNLPGQVVG